jgi:hypothetical protein
MEKSAMALLTLLLLSLAACGAATGEEECPEGAACAPENPEPVPDVVGMRLKSACPVMSEAGYSGGVRKIIDRSEERAGTILRLETDPGTRASEGEVIMMHVAGPVSGGELPQGCVSRIPGTF